MNSQFEYKTAMDALRYTDEQKALLAEHAVQAARKAQARSHRPLLRTALIAACLTAALAVTAGATGILKSAGEAFAPIFGGSAAQTEIIDKIGYPIGASDTAGGVTITADAILGDAYNAASTLYVFPDGRKVTGDKVRDWEGLTVGTKVILGDADASGSPLQTLAKGAHPRRLIGEAVFAQDTWYIRPTGGSVRGSALNEKTLAAMPPGTKILVGYARGGPVTSKRLPAQICPTQWDAPDTFYLMPGKPLCPSGEIDMKRVPPGTLVFYRN